MPNRIHTWPYLVRLEFICSIIIMIVMTVWSITINAPTEEAANPNRTPNPSKAPWYFLGLQEMLVYFDPWMAGVVLPSFIWASSASESAAPTLSILSTRTPSAPNALAISA